MDMKQSVLEKIFSNLNVYQLQRVVLVNKRFNRIIRNSKVIHNKFQLKLNKQKMESPEIAVLNRIMKKHRIKFNGFNISFLGAADRILDLDEFEMFLHTSVTSLVLNGAILDLATLKYLLDEVPNLTHVRIIFGTIY